MSITIPDTWVELLAFVQMNRDILHENKLIVKIVEKFSKIPRDDCKSRHPFFHQLLDSDIYTQDMFSYSPHLNTIGNKNLIDLVKAFPIEIKTALTIKDTYGSNVTNRVLGCYNKSLWDTTADESAYTLTEWVLKPKPAELLQYLYFEPSAGVQENLYKPYIRAKKNGNVCFCK
jgi:hypothetical protein